MVVMTGQGDFFVERVPESNPRQLRSPFID